MIEWTGERFLPWVYADGARLHYEHLHRYAFAADLGKNKSILDLACGEGYGAFLMSQQARHVVAVDIDEQTINHAKSRYSRENLDFIKGSIVDVPIKGQKLFDIITCFEGLEHISHHDSLLSEVKRLLASDGLFIVSTPNRKVLTDELGYQNAFHLKELYLEEFKSLLGNYFKHTIFFGQKVYSGSNLWDLASEEHSHQEYRVEKTDKELSLIHSEKKSPWYILGIASDNELGSLLTGANSWLIDVSDSLVKYYSSQLSELANTVQNKDDQLRIKDGLISSLNNEIQNQSGQLRIKDGLISYLNNEIQNQSGQLRIKDGLISYLNNEIQNQSGQLRIKDGQILSLNNEIKELNNSLGTKNVQIQTLEDNIRTKGAQLYNLQIQTQQSITLKVQAKYQKVVEWVLPPNTKRRYYYELGLNGMRIILDEGWRSFFKKVKQRYTRSYNSPKKITMKLGKPGNLLSNHPNIETYIPSNFKQASNIIHKVLFLPGDEIRNPSFTSCRYRIDNIVEGLTGKGIECNVCYENIAEQIDELPTADVAIIYRAALSENVRTVIDKLKQRNVPIIFDTDDLIFDPDSAKYIDAWKTWTSSHKYEYTKSFRDTLVICDFATCTTEFLANKIRLMGKKTFVIPNTLNKIQFNVAERVISKKNRENNGKIKIGYFSGTKTHDKDFLEAAESLCEVLERYENTEFHLVGDLDLPDRYQKLSTRIIRKPFMLYPEMLEYLSQMDINIAPLEQNNPFNDGKSELKIFEPALVRVPTVASRTNSYSACIKDGKNGFLAGSKGEWIQKLVQLVESKELRKNMGLKARKDFVEKFYIDNVIDGIIEIYENIRLNYREEKIAFRPPVLISTNNINTISKNASDKPIAIAISLVRNEGDIISAWMSHICALFDVVYIVDHLSTDGTRQFLLEMAESRENIKVFSFEQMGYFQSEITNYLAEKASFEYPDSWVFPLDADEFLSIASRVEFLALIKNLPKDQILKLNWKNCIPECITEDTQFNFKNPCLIAPFQSIYYKVSIHSSCFVNNSWRFSQGSHGIIDSSGNFIKSNNQCDFVDILHVPIRSLDHFALKCSQGYLAYEALPAERKNAGQGFHWREMIDIVLKQNMLNPDQVREFAANYGQPQLYTNKGLIICNMIRDGWICAPFNIAHLETIPQFLRRYKYLELAREILNTNANRRLESFIKIVDEFDKRQSGVIVSESVPCLDRAIFKSLDLIFPPDANISGSMTNIDLLNRFNFKAFTPHETPFLSGWEGHVPFLFCLIDFFKPRRFVELGTHYGNSFFAACQISQNIQLPIECIAVDTWKGDKQAGFYGEEIFKQFKDILNKQYKSVGKYIRGTFDEAHGLFGDGSIDLLHIDGLHTYEAVSHDFNNWLLKMSDTGIVMFHDTQERGGDFGVWRFWQEVKDRYPSFEFEHEHGLGVILVGENSIKRIERLFNILKQPDYCTFVKFYFSQIGQLSPIRAPSK
jgi:glycosyltransferase involved in cell wall biosynthesis/ubiquinone/menaquinone biosynthesis C-methylase UbiE